MAVKNGERVQLLLLLSVFVDHSRFRLDPQISPSKYLYGLSTWEFCRPDALPVANQQCQSTEGSKQLPLPADVIIIIYYKNRTRSTE